MRVSTALPGQLRELPGFVHRAEGLGYDLLVANETAYDPFLRLGVAAIESERAHLTTAVALAFPRSPYVLAQQAWEIQRASGGRLVLGLGTQIKGHMERRFSIPWAPPGPRMRDYVGCLRAIWRTWQYGEPSDYEGEYYRFQRMNPASDPGPIEHPEIPILFSAVNPYIARLCGEIGDGIVLHPFGTPQHLEEVLLPQIRAGARRAGREPATLRLQGGGGFIATGKTTEEVEAEREWARSRVAYYASTRSYHGVLAVHGWEELGMDLHRLSMENRWEEMTRLITDEILAHFVTAGTWDELPTALEQRYAGVASDISFAPVMEAEDDAEQIAEVIERIRRIPAYGQGVPEPSSGA